MGFQCISAPVWFTAPLSIHEILSPCKLFKTPPLENADLDELVLRLIDTINITAESKLFMMATTITVHGGETLAGTCALTKWLLRVSCESLFRFRTYCF